MGETNTLVLHGALLLHSAQGFGLGIIYLSNQTLLELGRANFVFVEHPMSVNKTMSGMTKLSVEK